MLSGSSPASPAPASGVSAPSGAGVSSPPKPRPRPPPPPPPASPASSGCPIFSSDAAGGLYGAGRFGYSIPFTASAALGAGSANTGSGAGTITDAGLVNYDSVYSASLASYKKVYNLL